jgi:hypothetical protein
MQHTISLLRSLIFSAKGKPALLLVLVCSATGAFAQSTHQKLYSKLFRSYYYPGPLAIHASGGAAFYNGDLSNNFDLKDPRGGLGVGVSYLVLPGISLGAEINYLRLAGTDKLPQRGITFGAYLWEATAFARLLPIIDRMESPNDRRAEPHLIKPYLLAGIGAARFTSRSQPYEDREATYPKTTLVLPVGLGAVVRLSDYFSLLPEVSYRFTGSDLLDDVSARGNSGHNDGYLTAGLKVQFTPWKNLNR